jgi:uncharacterized protein
LGRTQKKPGDRSKHGVCFEEAQSIFSDPHARLFHDSQHSEEEDRLILAGASSAARTLVVIHCYRESDSEIADHFCAQGNQEGDSIS